MRINTKKNIFMFFIKIIIFFRLKEACDVIGIYIEDPVLAFLSSRIVEFRMGISARIRSNQTVGATDVSYCDDGYILGTESRRVLSFTVLPKLCEDISGNFSCLCG
jgi:hypothetical protein